MILAMALLAAATTANPTAAEDKPYDLILAGGRVVDGTGAPWFRAGVGVRGARSPAGADLSKATARRRIPSSKLVRAPGFIDMLGQYDYNALVHNRAASKITQGITTEITGEGSSIAPVNATMIEADAAIWTHYGVKPDWTTLAGYFQAFE